MRTQPATLAPNGCPSSSTRALVTLALITMLGGCVDDVPYESKSAPPPAPVGTAAPDAGPGRPIGDGDGAGDGSPRAAEDAGGLPSAKPGCNSPSSFQKIIENLDTTEPLRLDGAASEGTLVRNCRFHDIAESAVFIRNTKNIRIENCRFENITGQAAIQVSSTGSTENVAIVGNQITNAGQNGVTAAQRYDQGVDHKNLCIVGNKVHDTGTSVSGGLAHSLYIQASDFRIEGNTITGKADGNGISVRSSGVIRGNTVAISSGAGKSAIKYYSDHARGPSNTLVIENNIAYLGSSGTVVLISPPTESSDSATYVGNHVVENHVIRFNTILQQHAGVALEGASGTSAHPLRYTVTGNVLANTAGGGLGSFPSGTSVSSNYETRTLDPFVKPTLPYDLHLKPGQPACDFVSSTADRPDFDVDGQPRPSTGTISAGADECAPRASTQTHHQLRPGL